MNLVDTSHREHIMLPNATRDTKTYTPVAISPRAKARRAIDCTFFRLIPITKQNMHMRMRQNLMAGTITVQYVMLKNEHRTVNIL